MSSIDITVVSFKRWIKYVTMMWWCLQLAGVIRCSELCSKIKVIIMVWNLNDYIVIVILNPTQLVLHETNSVWLKKWVLSTLSNRWIFKKMDNPVNISYCWHGTNWAGYVVVDLVEVFSVIQVVPSGTLVLVEIHNFLLVDEVANHWLTCGWAKGRHVEA